MLKKYKRASASLMQMAIFCAFFLRSAECWVATVGAQDRVGELPAAEVLEAPCAPEIETTRRAAIEHGGVLGMWFHIEVARCMVDRLALLPAYARHVRLLEERSDLGNERDALRARELEIAVREADAARAALEAALRRAREAEQQANDVVRHPALWAGVGALVVILIEVVSVWAFSQIN